MAWFDDYYDESGSYKSSTKTSWEDWKSSWKKWKEEGYWTDRRKTYKSSLGHGGRSLTSTTSYISNYYSSAYGTGHSAEDSDRAEKLLSKTYSTVREFVIILNFPFDVHVQFVGNRREHEYKLHRSLEQRRIFVDTSIFDDKTKSDEEVINVTCGFGIHEAAHLLYTEYELYKTFFDDSSTLPGKVSTTAREFMKKIFELIEDERVEDKLLSNRPGYLDFIKYMKDYSFKKYTGFSMSKDNKFCQFFDTLIRLIRFPDEIDEKVIESYSELYGKIKEQVTPLPERTKESLIASKNIVNLILSEFSEDDISILTSAMSQINTAINIMSTEILYGYDKDSEIDPSKKRIGKIIDTNEYLYKMVMGTMEKGSKSTVFFEKKVGDRGKYLEVSKKVSRYVPAIKKLISGVDKNTSFNIHGCRYGLLDTSKLAEAYQGVPQVYIRQGHSVTNKTTVCVLIDESGSMGGSKERKAVEAGILLNEALGSLPGVDLYVYGHTADIGGIGNLNMSIYREGSVYKPKYSMSDIKARCQNRDGEAIIETAKRVRKFTQSQCIMFVISDGEPAAYGYGGYDAIKDVRNSVTTVENMGFEVIQISIDYVYRVQDMFTNYIDIKSSLSDMPKLLGNIIKKCIVKSKKTLTVM